MDNFATYNRPALRDGQLLINLAVQPDVPMGLIAIRDVGEFAALALTRPAQFLGHTHLAALRAIHPGLMSLRSWLVETGWRP
jgi:hypothetical protein